VSNIIQKFKNDKMKKLKLLLLIAGALSMWQLKAQTGTSCSNAVLITQPHAQVYIGNTTFQWYKFDATSSNMRLNISEKSNQINISKIELYSGSCTSLTLLTKDSLTFNLDSVKTIQSSSITIGTSF
jgi:hypothetical protein